MKNIILITFCSLMMCSCFLFDKKEQSAAKDASWDYWLIGSWHYKDYDSDTHSEWPEGIECFYGNGDYENYTQTSDGKKALVSGQWKLSQKEKFVVLVHTTSVKTSEGTVSNKEKTVKYVINSIKPGSTLTYMVGKTFRAAMWADDDSPKKK
ncbi:MAG: hypothetical protein J5510_00325 [Prevotella sp.]|nr:hypothetical protein [Prevotella sp.]